jgi:hypothetical protein
MVLLSGFRERNRPPWASGRAVANRELTRGSCVQGALVEPTESGLVAVATRASVRRGP